MLFRFLARQWIHATASRMVERAVRQARAPSEQQEEEEPEKEHLTSQLPPCDVAVICADPTESMGLRGLLEDVLTTRCASLVEHAGQLAGRRVVIAEGGSGSKSAATATEDIIQMHQPRWVIAAGFATALAAEFEHEHLLMADPVMDAAGNQLQLGTCWDEAAIEKKQELHLGSLLSHEQVVHTPRERRRLAREHGAVALDIESIGVARACRQQQVPCMVVRVITETLDEELPLEVTTLIQQNTTAGKLGAFTGAMFRRFSSVKDIWQLKDRAYRASDRLGRYLASVIRQLPAAED
jgi:adenosylhomocysteine nucleosidase